VQRDYETTKLRNWSSKCLTPKEIFRPFTQFISCPLQMLHILAAGEGADDRALVGVLQVAAHRQTACQAGHLDVHLGDALVEKISCGIAFHAGVGGEYHFLHIAPAQALQEGRQLDVIRPDALDGREQPMQDVVFAVITAGALEGDDIHRLFDYADHSPIPIGVSAYFAYPAVRLGNVEALFAKPGQCLDLRDGFSQGLRDLIGGSQQVKSQPGGGLGADAGQLCQRFNKVMNCLWK